MKKCRSRLSGAFGIFLWEFTDKQKNGSDRLNLSMQKINKSFGANRVLRDVDFSLGTGEICALLGENLSLIHI